MVTFEYATATGLSNLLDGEISHDTFTRFLSNEKYTSFMETSKQYEKSSDGVIADTIQELICWHYDHIKGRFDELQVLKTVWLLLLVILITLLIQPNPHQRQQFISFNRFGQIVISSGFNTFSFIFLHGFGSQSNYR